MSKKYLMVFLLLLLMGWHMTLLAGMEEEEKEKSDDQRTPSKPTARVEKSMIEKVINAPIVRSIGTQLIRSTFSMLFGGRKTTTRKKNGFF